MKKNTKSTQDFYNQEAQTYKKMYEPGYEYYPANLIRLKLIIKRLKENNSKKILDTFNMLNSSCQGKFHDAPSFQQAYLTDIIDELIQTNEDVNPIFVDGNWCEIDTLEDLEIAREKIRD